MRSPLRAPGRVASRLRLSRRHWQSTVLAGIGAALLAVSVWLVPRLEITGTPVEVAALELGTFAPAEGAVKLGPIVRVNVRGRVVRFPPIAETVDGYIVEPRGRGRIVVPIRAVPPDGRAYLRIWASGNDGVRVSAFLESPDGARTELGRPIRWFGKPFDVTDASRQIRMFLVVDVRNETPEQFLFLDRVAQVNAPAEAIPRVSPIWFALLAGLLFAFSLQAFGKLARHWSLAILGTISAYVLWDDAAESALSSLPAEGARLWAEARGATWFGLESGLVSGAYGDVSSLTVQLFHALAPMVGEGEAAARSATVIVGLAALAAIYALGNRIAGRWAGLLSASLALLADRFREAAIDATSVTTMVLAAALFVYAIHASLSVASVPAMVGLAAAGGVAVLADSIWLAGVVLTVTVIALLYAPHGMRMRHTAIGLAVLFLLLLPNRLAVAQQYDGDILGDVGDRATLARNIEFAGGGHGAPSPGEFARDPLAGERVGLAEYIIGDHSNSVTVGATLSGLQDAFVSFADRDETRLAGLAAFLLGLFGFLYLLIVPKLRTLAILPILVAAPALFLADRGIIDPFRAGTALWPSFVAGGALFAYVLSAAYGGRIRRALSLTDAGSLLSRRRRRNRETLDTPADDVAPSASASRAP